MARPRTINIRTEYRYKRIALIREIINLLITMLLFSKYKIEDIPLDFFKKVKKNIEDEINRVGESSQVYE